jgi:peroxiredoxin
VKGDQFPSRDVILIDDKGKIMKILRGVNPSTHRRRIAQEHLLIL